MRRRPVAALCSTAAVVGGVFLVAPAWPAAATGSASITVMLKPPNAAALARLAHRTGLTRAQRVAAVERLLPSAAEHATAIRALQADGFRVTDESSWSVTAAASAATVRELFGARPLLPDHATTAQFRAATGPLPRLPAGLARVASAAFPTSGGPDVFHHSDLNGSDFRNAYTSPALTSAGIAPYSGADAAGRLTIATIQLSGWNSSDLSTYAANNGIAFNAATDLTQVPVAPLTSVPGPAVGDDSDIEVDLDQESILSTDPFAHQRAYFADNSDAAFEAAFAQVLDDVLQNSHSYNGGDPHIAALSSSWGLCEAQTTDIPTLEPIIDSIVAAGVTVFASSGDDGIYDCATNKNDIGVDYPASSAVVVGVGGTNLSASGPAAPNTGTNWAESAWSCISFSTCTDPNTGTGGSGGGVSSQFPAPTYQSAIADAPFAGNSHRLVPDIAADGDPSTGFDIYTTDPTDTTLCLCHSFPVGGTSLASPVSAALLTNMLAAHNATAGVGDIHAALYAAYAANNGSFRDVTSGTNGASADRKTDPSVSAQTGYDTVTGLGGVLWPKIAGQLYHPTSLTLARTARAVVAGSKVVLSGRLVDARTHTGVAKAPVIVTSTLTGGRSASVRTTTSSTGNWSLSLHPLRTATYRASFATSGSLLASRTASSAVSVKYRLAITHISRTARASKPVIARGSLLPADRNVRITLYQVSKAGKLHRLIRARTDAHGKWTAKWRMVKGRYKIVAAVASQRYDLGNRSATVRVRRT